MFFFWTIDWFGSKAQNHSSNYPHHFSIGYIYLWHGLPIYTLGWYQCLRLIVFILIIFLRSEQISSSERTGERGETKRIEKVDWSLTTTLILTPSLLTTISTIARHHHHHCHLSHPTSLITTLFSDNHSSIFCRYVLFLCSIGSWLL